MDAPEREITMLLQQLEHTPGQPPEQRQVFWQRLLELIYGELRALAHHQRAKFHAKAPRQLQTTELVHELYARLDNHLERGGQLPQHSEHFFALAARAMRQLIIDTIRHDQRARRGGGLEQIELDEQKTPLSQLWFGPERIERFVEIHQALEQLEQVNPDHVRLIEMHLFLGLTLEEIADIQDVSHSTIKRRWRMARAWLATSLSPSA